MNKCKIYNYNLDTLYKYLKSNSECKKKKNKDDKIISYLNKIQNNSEMLINSKINSLGCIIKNILENSNIITDEKPEIKHLQEAVINLQEEINIIKSFIDLTFVYDLQLNPINEDVENDLNNDNVISE
jgi:DNA topoisomerase VI subunit B